ncbi:MAG: PIN domain-containing protein [Candidatus Nanopelagicales bacterium]|nr:PIN domain-containing protein [Candidatus Nanopelagicales bacterium]
MNSRLLADTNVWILPPRVPLRAKLMISVVTIAELELGILGATNHEEKRTRQTRLDLIKRKMKPLPVDQKVATSYGIIGRRTLDAGRQPRRRCMDLLIASTAHAYGVALATRNATDFDHLDGLIEIIKLD